MILKGRIGKLTAVLLTRFSLLSRHFKVVKWGDSVKVFKTKSIKEITKTEITPAKILGLKFDLYDSFRLLKQYTAQVESMEKEQKLLVINVWESEQMITLIKRFPLSLTDQTYSALKQLLSDRVFDKKLGDSYNYFISVWLQYDIKNA